MKKSGITKSGMTKEQKENLHVLSKELSKHSPLIKELFHSSKNHEKAMFNREIFFGLSVFVITGLLAYFGKLNGETLAGLIGVIIGYVMGNKQG